MAETFGNVRGRLLKLPHGAGTDLDALNGIINDRYMEIMRHYEWSLLKEVDTILQLVAIYDTGTIAVTEGSANITGTGTTWTAGMTGRRIRPVEREEWYTFTYISPTSGTLDRVYDGDTDAAASYKIFKSIYALASDVGTIDSLRDINSGAPLEKKSRDFLDSIDPSRRTYGTELFYFAQYEDASGIQQIELWPIPEEAEGLPYSYKPTVARLSSTSATFVEWLSIECLVAGCEASLYGLKKDPIMSASKYAEFQHLLSEMVREDSSG